MEGPGNLIGLIVIAALFLIPTIVAFIRHQPNKWAILAMNILLGWTVVGWIVALIWSLTAPKQNTGQPTIIVNQVQGDQTTTTAKEDSTMKGDSQTSDSSSISRKFRG